MERLEIGLEPSRGIRVLFGAAVWISQHYVLHLLLLTSLRECKSLIVCILFIDDASLLFSDVNSRPFNKLIAIEPWLSNSFYESKNLI